MTASPSRTEPPPGEAGSPLHGFQGHRAAEPTPRPRSLTIALSRETGSRGGTIARRVGKKIGWQVYNQEMLDFISQEGTSRDGAWAQLPPDLARWAEDWFERLRRDGKLAGNQAVMEVVRIILALGAQGDVVLVGRGAGCLLPRETTLHVRVIAPLPDRVAYMSQWMRWTTEEAAEQVRLRDKSRGAFMREHFQFNAADPYQYDLLINSSLLGEDLSVELIVQAARAKLAALNAPANAQPSWEPTSV